MPFSSLKKKNYSFNSYFAVIHANLVPHMVAFSTCCILVLHNKQPGPDRGAFALNRTITALSTSKIVETLRLYCCLHSTDQSPTKYSLNCLKKAGAMESSVEALHLAIKQLEDNLYVCNIICNISSI